MKRTCSPFQFQFVNSFLALFYTAFYLQDMDKLKEVSAIIYVTRMTLYVLQTVDAHTQTHFTQQAKRPQRR